MESLPLPEQGVLLRGLPYSVTKGMIKQFFKNIEIRDDQITLILSRGSRHTGLGFVRLMEEEVQRALLNDRNHMSTRYIEVMASNEIELYELLLMARDEDIEIKELYRMAGRRSRGGYRDRSPNRRQVSTCCAYFSGVPRGFTYKHVREFFKGCLIGHNCIHMLREEGSGSFRGDGYVEFGNVEECIKGLRKNGTKMGDSILEVVPCSKDELVETIEKVNHRKGFEREDLRTTLRSRRAHRDERARTPSPVRKRMKAYVATYGRVEHEEQFDSPQNESYRHDYPQRSRGEYVEEHWAQEELTREIPFREAPPPRKEQHPPQMYHQQYGGDRGSQPVYPERVEYDRRPPQRPDPQQFTRGGPDLGNGYRQQHPPQPPPPQRQERRMVRLEGLPYETSARHIMDFFSDFRLQYEEIRIQCREDGSPSGKAFVVFPTEKHARAAVQSHDKHYILGRYIDVLLV